MTTGEMNLNVLLKTMRPVLQEGEYVFCTVQEPFTGLDNIPWVGLFREAEGLTLILKREAAINAGLSPLGSFAMITLNVHSSLEAVGFLAAICSRLAAFGISTNAVSAYYHDHLFIQKERAAQALALLEELSNNESL